MQVAASLWVTYVSIADCRKEYDIFSVSNEKPIVISVRVSR
jgi:hypothetical protein